MYMPYTHSGEIGDVWKHLPLCEVLKIEKPIRYHETNSAYSGYTILHNPRTEYGIFKMLKPSNFEFANSVYHKTLKKNGIDYFRYKGSPGLAMEILSSETSYFFHDLEQEALDDVEIFAQRKGLCDNVKTFCGDSVCAFLDVDYFIDEDDFIFIDPYTPFDVSQISGFNFFNVFDKSISANAKTLMWYGYDSLNGQQLIFNRLKKSANENKADIWSFDVWQKNMTNSGCELNPGVPGCGLACANMSVASIDIIERQLGFIKRSYTNAIYEELDAELQVEINRFMV